MPKSTKIVCTLGPATESPEMIECLVKAGMNVARLNFSHGSHKNFVQIIRNIRKIEEKLKIPITILQDLQGPRIRIGKINKNGIEIKKGREIIVYPENVLIEDRKDSRSELHSVGNDRAEHGNDRADDTSLPIDYPLLAKDLKKGHRIFIDNGYFELKVIQKKKNFLICKVIHGGIIYANKGINLPDSHTSFSSLTKKDKKDIAFGLKHNVDFIALSFAEKAKDIENLKTIIAHHEKQRKKTLIRLYDTRDKKTHEGHRTRVIAKIERNEAIDNFDAILEAADGIMIARGDLGIETSLEKVPLLQKKLVQKCIAHTKPCIVATQMLESMIEHPNPTRAEVSDTANAILDGADAIMLSGETSIGKHPIKAVQIMSRIAKSVEPSLKKENPEKYITQHRSTEATLTETVSMAAYKIAEQLKAKAIICATNSGFTAKAISRYKPPMPIYAITPSAKTRHQLMLNWGVESYLLPFTQSIEDLIQKAVRFLKKEKKIRKNDTVVIAAGYAKGYKIGRTNLIKVHIVR